MIVRVNLVYAKNKSLGAWVYSVVVIAPSHYRKTTSVGLDQPGYVREFFVDVFWSFSKHVLQTWLYYITGALTDDISELTRYTGILRGIEPFAQVVAYGLTASKNIDAWVGINLGLLVLPIYPTWLVVKSIDPPEDGDATKDIKSRENESVKAKEDTHNSDLSSPELVKVANVAS